MLRELLSDVSYRMRALFRRGTMERELDDELRFHLERQADELERGGLPRDEALRKARLAFGGLESTKEAARDARGTALVESLLQDLRYALRVLRKQPGFSITVILVLGLGIGANVATFTVMDALLLRTLPVPHAEELVIVGDPDSVGSDWVGSPVHRYASYPVYQDLRDRNHVLSGLYASGNLYTPDVVIPGTGGAIEHPTLRVVTENFFDVLRVRASIGRAIVPDDGRGGEPVIVLSYRYWQRRFGGDPSAVGREMVVNRVPLTIVGVTPASFPGDVVGQIIDGWVPMAIEPLLQPKVPPLTDRSFSWLQMMGRLAPGVDLSRARSELAALEAESIRSHATGNDLTQFDDDLREEPINVQSGARGFSRGRRAYGPALNILMAAVALVVLIVCANVSNLMLVRGVARGREITVRMTLGAGRSRLVRQLFTESLLLAAAGGLVGCFVAGGGSRLLLAMAGTQRGPIPLDVSPDARVLAFTAFVTILAALLFGLAPAARATRVEIATALRAGGPSLVGAHARLGRFAAGKALVVVQIALSVVLLVGAGLLIRTMQRIVEADLGFDRDHVLVARVNAEKSGYEGPRSFTLMRDLVDHLRAVPSVTGVSTTMHGLFTGNRGSVRVDVPGFTPSAFADLEVEYDAIGPDFFRTIGARIQVGRDFDAGDSEKAERVAIINRTAATAYFHGVNPIGRVILDETEDHSMRPATIVAVVDDIQARSVRAIAGRWVYFPIFQRDVQPSFVIVVRVAGEATKSFPAIRDALLARYRNLRFEIRSVNDLVADSVAEDRLTTRVTTFFGAVALLLAALGLYGVTAYATSQRTSELGLRIALGADPRSVTRMIVGEGARLAALGLAAGIPMALVATALIRRQLFQVNPFDPATLSLAAVVLAGMALLASYIPARRAARIAPLEALRVE
jgi:predicted permease